MKMPALILVVAATLLSAGPASSQDGVNPPAKEQIKASEQKIKELQKERLAALKKTVDIFTKLIRAGRDDFEDSSETRLLLLQAELGAVENEADQIALYKKAIDSLKEYEASANNQVNTGRSSATTVLRIKARRLELEIQLGQAKAKRAKPGTALAQIKQLQRERIDALTEQVGTLTKQAQKMSGEFGALIEARRLLLQAELDVVTKASDRVALHKQVINSLKDYEVWANARVQSGRATDTAVLGIQARRLEFEIQLEQAKIQEAKEAAVMAILSVAPAGPKDKANPPAKEQTEELQKQRIAILDKLLDQLSALTQKIKALQTERVTVLKKQLDLLSTLFKKARVPYDQVLEAEQLLIEAELDAAESDTKRVELSKNLTVVLGQKEVVAKSMVMRGRVTNAAVLQAKAMRLNAEIQLEQARMTVARQEGTHPRPPDMIPPRPADMIPPHPPEQR
jgi:outer membrane protein TolC